MTANTPRHSAWRIIIATIALALCISAQAAAQNAAAPGAPTATSDAPVEAPASRAPFIPSATATATTPAPTADATAEPALAAGSEARALIAILRDEAARERLIADLERVAADAPQPAAESPGTPDGAAPDAQSVPLASRIAAATHDLIRSNLSRARDFAVGVRATIRRLSGLANADPDRILAAVGTLASVVVVTMLVRVVSARALGVVRRRIASSAVGLGPLRKGIAVSAAAVLDVLSVLLAAVGGHAVAIALIEPVGEVKLYQTLYLNAFALVGVGCAAIRIFLAPRTPSLRLAAIGEPMAVYLMRWSILLLGTLGYGLMLVVPIIEGEVNLFTARAVSVVILALVVFVTIALVIMHRRGPREHFEARAAESGGDVTLGLMAFVARFWHIAVVIYLLAILSAAVRQSGNIAPLIDVSGKILGASLLGTFVMALLSRASSHGIRLPASVTRQLPLLEGRINTFVPPFLKLIRLVVMLLVVGFGLQVAGIADIQGRIGRMLGVDIIGSAISVTLISVVGFVLWLSLASWVEYRLTPRRGRRVTSREQTLLTLLRNAATIGIAVITGMFALSEIGVNIAPLLASAGVLGLAIGFGAQRMVQDIITGIFIQFESAINVGDVVTVAGTTGTVEKLTIRSVSLRDVQGVFHIIPFSSVDAVSNYMRGFAYHVADIGIAYREDVDEAKALMLEAFEALRADPDQGAKVLGDLEWFGVQTLGDSAVVLRARIKTRPGDQWAVGRAYNEAVKKRFDRAGVEIPFPHMTIWFGENRDGTAPPAQVALSERGIARTLIEGGGAPPPQGRGRKRKAAAPTQDTPLDDDGRGDGDEAGR